MNDCRVVLRGHVLRRDIAALIVLKRLLERKGCQVIISNASNHLEIARLWRPHVVVENVMRKAKFCREVSENSKIFLLHSEGTESVAFSEYKKRGDTFLESFDKICSWGPYRHKLIMGLLPKNQQHKAVVVGGTRLDLVKYQMSRPKTTSNSVGIVGRFSRLNNVDGVPPIRRIKSQLVLDLVLIEAKTFYTFMNIIRAIIAKTEFDISYRPHPAESPEGCYFLREYFGKRIVIDESLDIAEWISRQRCLIASASTSFVEAYLLKVPCINIDKISNVKYQASTMRMNAYDAGTNPQTLEVLIQFVHNPPEIPINQKTESVLKDTYNWGAQGSALNTMANLIVEEGKSNKNVNRPYLPKKALEILSWLRFRRAYHKNPLIANSRYDSFYHKKPYYLFSIADKIWRSCS